MPPATFDIKIVQKQATPGPVTTAIGTGSSATRTEFFIAMAPLITPAQLDGQLPAQLPLSHQQKD